MLRLMGVSAVTMARKAHVSINNRWLPFWEDDKVESDLSMSNILDGIRGVLEKEEEIEAETDGGPQWNNRGLVPHLKKLHTYIRLRYPLKSEDVATFLDLATRLVLSEKLPVRAQIKMLQSIVSVLSAVKARCMRVEGFSIDARPLYKLLIAKTLGPEEGYDMHGFAGAIDRTLRTVFPQAMYHLRHYFSLESVRELLKGFNAELQSTTQTRALSSMCLMVLLTPTRLPPELYDELLPGWLSTWRRLDNCPEWDLLWLHLFCRARKHARTFPWEEHMPTFFSYLLSVFSLPLGTEAGAEMRSFPSRLRCLFQPQPMPHNRLMLLAKLSVFFLGRGGDATVDVVVRPHLPNKAAGEESHPIPCSLGARHLILLLSSIRTYFHPSNSARYSEELAAFMGFFCAALSKRVGWELADKDYGVSSSSAVALPHFPSLTKRDVDAVTGALLPLVHQSLYSKYHGAVKHAEQALKHLACLRPKLVAELTLPLLLSALDPSCLTTTHQAPSALSALSVLVRPLLYPVPYLLSHLPLLLEWSMPGLDSNDPYKTACTIQFYLSVLDWLPLRADIPRTPHEDGPGHAFRSLPFADEDEASTAAMLWDRAPDIAPVLSDWAMAVLDRYLTMLQTKEKPSSSVTGAAKVAVGHMESGMSSLGKILCRQLYGQMDASMHARATARLVSFITSNTIPGAVKDVAYVVEACCRQPRSEAALKLVVPALLDGWQVSSASTRIIEWRMRLLAGAIRLAGPVAMQYVDPIVKLVKQVADHEDKAVRKAGGKLLRRTLQTLVEIYPDPSASHSADTQGGPLVLCPPTPEKLNMAWYVPGEKELEAAVHVFEALVEPSLAALRDMPQGELTTAQKHELETRWRNSLKTVLNGIRSISPLLTDLPGVASDDDVLRIGTSLLLRSANLRVATFIHSLRARLATALHQALPLLTHEHSPLHRDVKAIKTWVKSASFLLCARGSYQGRRAKMYSNYMVYAKANGRNWITEAYRRSSRAHEAGGRALSASAVGLGADAASDFPRSVLVSRVYGQHLLRCEEAASMVPRRLHSSVTDSDGNGQGEAEDPYRLLIQDLLELSAYDMSTVRARAQEAFGSSGLVYPWFLKGHLPSLLQCLTLTSADEQPNRIHERATAATFLLRQKPTIRMVSSSWPLTRQIIEAMAVTSRMVSSLPLDKQNTMSERLSRLTLGFMEVWIGHDIKSEKRRKEWQQLMDSLLAMIQTQALPSPPSQQPSQPATAMHWRYRLLIQWLLLTLARPDAERPPALWQSLLDGLRSGDGQPLQKLCLGGLFRLLAQELPAPQKRNRLTEKASSDEDEYVMLTDPVKEMEDDEMGVLVTPYLADALCEPSMLRTLCLALANIHREYGNSQSSTGVEDLIYDAWRRRGSDSPATRLSPSYKKFHSLHVYVVRLLLRALGPRLLVPLTEAAESILDPEKMPTESEDAYYATVAEILAGLMSEYTRTDVSDGRRKRMWAVVLPLFERLLARLSLDYSLDLAASLRFASATRRPEAFEPLTTLVLSKVISSLGGLAPGSVPLASVTVRDDYTSQAKWLRMAQGLLIEFVGEPQTRPRGQVLAGQLVPVLLSNLGHPYKVCRVEIAKTLYVIFSYGGVPLMGPHTGGVGVLDHVRAVALTEGDMEVKTLVSSTATQLTLQEGEKEQGGTPDETAGSLAWTQELTRRKETVLQWVLLSVGSGNHSDYVHYVVPLLPVLYECVRDKDMELAALGKHAVRGLARYLWFKERLAIDGSAAGPMSSPLSSPSVASPMEQEDEDGSENDAMSALLKNLLALSRHRSWYVKFETAQALALMQVEHAFLLRPEESVVITQRLVDLLGDERKEVQDTARLSLSAVLSAAEMGQVHKLADSYCDLGLGSVGASKRRKDNKGRARKVGKDEEAGGDATRQGAGGAADEDEEKRSKARAQHLSTMVLASLVLAYPYEVPPYVPRSLSVLARLFSGPPSLQAVIKKTFTDFKRTHQDEWESNHRLRFTSDELDALSDVLVSPHYYA